MSDIYQLDALEESISKLATHSENDLFEQECLQKLHTTLRGVPMDAGTVALLKIHVPEYIYQRDWSVVGFESASSTLTSKEMILEQLKASCEDFSKFKEKILEFMKRLAARFDQAVNWIAGLVSNIYDRFVKTYKKLGSRRHRSLGDPKGYSSDYVKSFAVSGSELVFKGDDGNDKVVLCMNTLEESIKAITSLSKVDFTKPNILEIVEAMSAVHAANSKILIWAKRYKVEYETEKDSEEKEVFKKFKNLKRPKEFFNVESSGFDIGAYSRVLKNKEFNLKTSFSYVNVFKSAKSKDDTMLRTLKFLKDGEDTSMVSKAIKEVRKKYSIFLSIISHMNKYILYFLNVNLTNAQRAIAHSEPAY